MTTNNNNASPTQQQHDHRTTTTTPQQQINQNNNPTTNQQQHDTTINNEMTTNNNTTVTTTQEHNTDWLAGSLPTLLVDRRSACGGGQLGRRACGWGRACRCLQSGGGYGHNQLYYGCAHRPILQSAGGWSGGREAREDYGTHLFGC